MKSIYIILSLILLTSSATFAQSQYLDDRQNGIEIGVGYQSADAPVDDILIYSVGFGIQGIFNFGMQLGKFNGGTIFAPYFEGYLIKQDEQKETFMSLSGFIKPELSQFNNETISAFTVGGIISKDIVSQDGVGFYPFFLASYTMTSGVYATTYGSGVSIHFGKSPTSSLNFGYYTTAEQSSLTFSYTLLFKFDSGSKRGNSYKID